MNCQLLALICCLITVFSVDAVEPTAMNGWFGSMPCEQAVAHVCSQVDNAIISDNVGEAAYRFQSLKKQKKTYGILSALDMSLALQQVCGFAKGDRPLSVAHICQIAPVVVQVAPHVRNAIRSHSQQRKLGKYLDGRGISQLDLKEMPNPKKDMVGYNQWLELKGHRPLQSLPDNSQVKQLRACERFKFAGLSLAGIASTAAVNQHFQGRELNMFQRCVLYATPTVVGSGLVKGIAQDLFRHKAAKTEIWNDD
ncbi:hypothetical protein MIR68_011956 [Amoeboaphelidium protococcarum]|nr:hypothetical protein MIR68_011956 [Amoeboaphelidium protococcarum]